VQQVARSSSETGLFQLRHTKHIMSKNNLRLSAFIALFVGIAVFRFSSHPLRDIIAFAPFFALVLFTKKVHFLRSDGWLPRLLSRTAPARSLLDIHDKTAGDWILDRLLKFVFVFALLCWTILVLKLWPA